MAIDLCIESAGWVAQFVEASVVHPLLPLRRSVLRVDKSSLAETQEPGDQRKDVAFIREAASNLPIDQAEAIWLVDVCGYSYAKAAHVIGVDRPAFAVRIAEARRAIRHSIADPAR